MLVRILAALASGFLLLQFVRPELPAGPSKAELQAPIKVKQILRQSCYACHSNERRLSWFDEIVPAYWLVVHDVTTARKHLNFSELGAQPAAVQRAKLFEAVNFIGKGVMPLSSYARLHPEVAVTSAQQAILRDYLHPNAAIRSVTAVEAADAEYRKWLTNSAAIGSVQPSPNGIAFPRDYSNWKVIDSTTRFDTNTMRIILGNDIAIKAIAANKTNPWPDGATLAKVGWYQQPDEHGVVQAGEFLKVGFMIKDKKKYASTAGWGWAEWAGVDLKPYGNGSDFASECVTCHMPLRKNDYVYTMPIHAARVSEGNTALNARAALTGNLPADPLTWSVITCGANPQAATMWTLFGNDEALQYSRKNADGKYPVGSTLSLVTWRQQEDGHWFGARMPAEPKSAEFVFVQASPDGNPSYSYRAFEGSPLKEIKTPKDKAEDRVAYLISQRAAVMP